MNLVDVSPPGESVSWHPMERKVYICIISPQSQRHCRQSWTVAHHLSQLSARSRLLSHISQPGKYTHYASRIILLPLLLWCCTVYNSVAVHNPSFQSHSVLQLYRLPQKEGNAQFSILNWKMILFTDVIALQDVWLCGSRANALAVWRSQSRLFVLLSNFPWSSVREEISRPTGWCFSEYGFSGIASSHLITLLFACLEEKIHWKSNETGCVPVSRDHFWPVFAANHMMWK